MNDALQLHRAVDPAWLRRVFGAFPTGVAAVGAVVDGEPLGMAVSSFTSVSLDPALLSVAVARSSRTWPVLRAAPAFGVSVLSSFQERGCMRLGAGGPGRFQDLRWRETNAGALLVEYASAWFECTVEREVEAGDHDIVLFRIHDLDIDLERPPLVFHGSRYRRLEHDGW